MFGDTIFGSTLYATIEATDIVIPRVKWRVQCPNQEEWTVIETNTSTILQCNN